MDPDPFTLRELLLMTEGRARATWGQTSSLMALIANVHKDPKKGRWLTPADFDPYARRRPRGIPLRPDNLSMLKALVPKPGAPKKTSVRKRERSKRCKRE